MFIDEIKIYARAGHGGPGCVAFHREAYRPKGGPSGGNGGRGGSVILQADHDLNNLVAQYYVPRLIAENGEAGKGKGMDGRAGKDLIIKVPCGTLVWQLPPAHPPAESAATTPAAPERDEAAAALTSSVQPRPVLRRSGSARALEYDLTQVEPAPEQVVDATKGERIADLTEHGQQFVLCQGGRGGLGNRNFATAVRQTPRFAQPGEPGTEGHYLFELRLMADVGLVGYPNAGKSTLLTAISRARPKIAPYPFTTLHPQIGIVEYPDYRRLTVCDVPGLIAGAHRNVGLGHAFLRHITRCKILVILLDMAGTDNRAPWEDYRQLLNELEHYNPQLLAKPRYVVANKMDEPDAVTNLPRFKRRIKKTPVLPMAAAFGEGINEFKALLRHALATAGNK
ncbi:MAG TPA: 50S ribosome-binding GTPase [Verrucomicrobiota bacterium]|nr:50S ribosome-binding GTPase [Verrucomicrobiota bacterium]HNT13789.1 50S ribosome-binding GTPase [Verrucomicrobiota bacterium]